MRQGEIKVEDSIYEDNKGGNLKEGESRILEYYNDDRNSKKDISSKLKLLYELTKIDKELADIKEEKGDLPERYQV